MSAAPSRRRLIALAAVMLAPACAQATAASPYGAWVAEEIGGVVAAAGVSSTLELAADGALSGSGGCNRYRGRAEIGDGTISISQIAATRMACHGPAMEQEARLFAALAAARRFSIAGERMTLLAEDGTTLARFRRGA
jgi:putative lipoprotein